MKKKFLLSLLLLCAMAAAGFPRIGALADTVSACVKSMSILSLVSVLLLFGSGE